MKRIKDVLLILIIAAGSIWAYNFFQQYVHEKKILEQVIERFRADSRIAEVLVTGVQFDEQTRKTFTTIKFLEYDVAGNPLEPKYFKFSGNIIQFQSLVIRFEDEYVRWGDRLKGKSITLFWKVFMLDGANTQEFEVAKMNEIPRGYKVPDLTEPFEKTLWENFWSYALNAKKRKEFGIKNAQIEAPGTMFIPGHLYTIKIEHDGGMRIDETVLPQILKGEHIPKE
ncbi:MAG: hypothetical protein ABIJ41_04070 [Candidatus Omnitrophota bacterium]